MSERVELRRRVLLGGLAQEVLVRGADAGNPLLLILHGGPGFAEMPLFTTYNADLEDHFLVAHWDQRGAGRSYAADIPAGSMTLGQFIADGLELIDWLTERFAQDRVYLLGHSWGSLLGAMIASERPAKLHAFIGAGQLVAGMRNEQASYAFTLRSAIEQDDSEAISALRAIEDRYTPTGGMTFADLVVQRGSPGAACCQRSSRPTWDAPPGRSRSRSTSSSAGTTRTRPPSSRSSTSTRSRRRSRSCTGSRSQLT